MLKNKNPIETPQSVCFAEKSNQYRTIISGFKTLKTYLYSIKGRDKENQRNTVACKKK